MLGASIGSGEWLIGPSAVVKYGLSLLWVTALAVLFQTIFNTELVRYTLYTGEPAFTGFMRTKPGSRFWAWTYTILYFLQNGWPGWAGATAGAVFFLWAGRSRTAGDARAVHLIGVGAYLLCVLILLLGGRRIERTMEILNWTLVLGILGTLAVLCVTFAEPSRFVAAAAGFAGFDTGTRHVPAGARRRRLVPDRRVRGLLGLRRRHQHHALELGARQGLRHGPGRGLHPRAGRRDRACRLAHTGSVFEPDAGALAALARLVAHRARRPVGHLLPRRAPGHGAAGDPLHRAHPARHRAARAGHRVRAGPRAGRARGPAMAVLLALVSVWILFKTQLDILEATVRSLTDMLWSASPRLRGWRGGDVRAVYFGVLAVVVAWGVVAIGLSQPIVLLQVAANVAGFVLALGSLHILRVNTTLLPPELRPSRARQAMLVAMSVFYGFFVWLWLSNLRVW